MSHVEEVSIRQMPYTGELSRGTLLQVGLLISCQEDVKRMSSRGMGGSVFSVE